MKGFILHLFHFCLLIFCINHIAISQLQVTSLVTPEQMAELLAGSGIEILNVNYTGDDEAKGHFFEDSIPIADFIMKEGIVLTSGKSYIIPGPNTSHQAGWDYSEPGDLDLSALLETITLDAAILELTFKPNGDSLFFKFAFGSEEYNELVGSTWISNDGCAIFISGSKPGGGNYEMDNIAQVPGTNLPFTVSNINYGWSPANVIPTGPCNNCEYYLDNTFGLEVEYDGFTNCIDTSILVYPDSLYDLKIVVADGVDEIFDSGIFLEKESFRSVTFSEFYSFSFDSINNSGLIYSVNGTLTYDSIFLEVPFGIDLSNLIASFNLSIGAEVFVDNTLQQTGVTINDFSSPVTYQVIGSNSYVKDWVVVVNFLPNHENSFLNFSFEAVNNPSLEEDILAQIDSNTIHLIVPYGTVLNGLVASFLLSDYAIALVNGTIQNSGSTPNDFYSPVTYKIQAENGDNKFYEVIVDVMENHENEIDLFSFENIFNPSLNTDIVGQIGDNLINLYVPASTDISALIATYMLSPGVDAYVNGLIQQSTITSNNFTNPLFYTIVAENGDENN